MKRVCLLLFVMCASFPLFSQQEWMTYYELSGGKRTPRYAETIEYSKNLADFSPMVHYTSFGVSPQGRELPMLIVDREGLTNPGEIKASGRVILMIQACIHPGESEGKDAGLMLVRDLVTRDEGRRTKDEGRGTKDEGRRTRDEKNSSGLRAQGSDSDILDNGSRITNPGSRIPDLLQHVSILFIPIFNVDGHERFGPYNRINQNGPEEMGWRVTATNLNLNRDFLKADAPEMKAWLTMYQQWNPDFFIDIHTTDGADYQYVLTYMMETLGQMDKGLTTWCDSVFLPAWTRDLEASGNPVFPYVQFRQWHNPKSGLERDVAPPMLSQGYVALRNRPGLLVETHMLKPYKQRVEASYQCLVASLQILNDQYLELKKLNQDADAFVQSPEFRSHPFPLRFTLSDADSIMVEFRGVMYDTIQSELTGGLWFKYSSVPETFTVPLFSTCVPSETTMLPIAYVIPVEWQEVISILKLHGIRMKEVSHDTNIHVSSYKFVSPRWRSFPYEGRLPLSHIEYTTFTEDRVFPAGSMIVETSQSAARVIAQLLEPIGDGSLLYWGFFNPIFEQKEYFEFYVMEPMAKQMLEEDPELNAGFEKAKAADSNFIKNQWQVLNWFLEHTPYRDAKRMVYPVGRIE
ncbi:MAG: M14 family metallopeptidase [Bacteroidales bacterium]|nr:M14 family metallopeptidase [Bacteroidales bacterium]